VWWSDQWDPKSYGRDYDFSKPFFEQWKVLFEAVPLPALHNEYSTMIESDYCNAANNLKNCYLLFGAGENKGCAYGRSINYCQDSFDLTHAQNLELCHDVVMVNRGYKIFSSRYCDDCHDVWFSEDLAGCSSCIGCINLKNKQYHVFNEPVSKEKFKQFVENLDLGSCQKRVAFGKKAKEFFLTKPHKKFHERKNVNTSGDYIYNSKNVKDSYLVLGGENVRYSQIQETPSTANAYDYSSFGYGAEWIYETVWCGLSSNNLKFCCWCYHAHDLEYCFGCHGSGDLFGCVGIRNGEYCILNKQYTKEEYKNIVLKIIEHMKSTGEYGEFFPPQLSPWAYNETSGDDYLQLSRKTVERFGFNWHDEPRQYQEATMVIADNIRDVEDNILNAILKCDSCGKNYKLIHMELEFCRQMGVPIPRQCPQCRHNTRIHSLNPIAIYERKCAKCGKDIQTSYGPDRPEIVYCEQCYQQEVV